MWNNLYITIEEKNDTRVTWLKATQDYTWDKLPMLTFKMKSIRGQKYTWYKVRINSTKSTILTLECTWTVFFLNIPTLYHLWLCHLLRHNCPHTKLHICLFPSLETIVVVSMFLREKSIDFWIFVQCLFDELVNEQLFHTTQQSKLVYKYYNVKSCYESSKYAHTSQPILL